MQWVFVVRGKNAIKTGLALMRMPSGCSKGFLTRRHGHHYGENQKGLMCPYLQQYLVIDNLMHNPVKLIFTPNEKHVYLAGVTPEAQLRLNQASITGEAT